MKQHLILLFSIISLSTFGAGYTVNSIPNPTKTFPNGYVSNPDGILSEETVQQLNVIIDSIRSQTNSEVAIAAVNSIGDEAIEPFATSLFETWGIGKKEQNNGLLILFVLDQRKVKFEPGYGLEGVLPDAICKRIQVQNMIPEFKNGDYNAGMISGLMRVASVLRKEPFADKVEKPIAWNEIIPVATGLYLLLIVLSWIWMANSVSKIRNNKTLTTNLARYKAIKNQKNGILILVSVLIPAIGFIAVPVLSLPLFWLILFIPVPFTTIPANLYGKYLMHKVRHEPIPCSECGGKMHMLSEKEEDAHLKLAQQFEEQLHAIDYDVFVCDNCKNEAIFTLDKPSAYTDCPQCGTKAFILHEKRMVVAPTYISQGTERITHKCKFCGYEENDNHNIPRLTRSGGAFVAGAAAGSILSGRGGFGGGGFGGDSGGGFGGSFGGGMSGGGGATSGW